MTQTALILGARGRFGRNCVEAFTAAGWTIRTFDRSTDDLTQKAMGADVIINALNPAYPDWARDIPYWTDKVIAAAKASGATVVIPGNVYVFGPQTPAPWGPGAPHDAQNPMGLIRVKMEAAYRDANIPTIILRAGDYIDTEASGNWFDEVLTKHLGTGVFTFPGAPDIPRAYAFLPDLARTAVMLCETRASLPRFADIAYSGYTLTGGEMRAALEKATGRDIRMKRFAWWQLRLLAPVWPLARRILEMRYIWDKPHWLEPGAHAALLHKAPVTPLDQALRAAI